MFRTGGIEATLQAVANTIFDHLHSMRAHATLLGVLNDSMIKAFRRAVPTHLRMRDRMGRLLV